MNEDQGPTGDITIPRIYGAGGMARSFDEWGVTQEEINRRTRHNLQLQQITQSVAQSIQRSAQQNATTGQKLSPHSSITNPSSKESEIKDKQKQVVKASTKSYDKRNLDKNVAELIRKEIKEKLWYNMKFCVDGMIDNFNTLEENNSVLVTIILNNMDEMKVAKESGRDLEFGKKYELFSLYNFLIPRTLNDLRTAKTKDIRVKMIAGRVGYLLFVNVMLN